MRQALGIDDDPTVSELQLERAAEPYDDAERKRGLRPKQPVQFELGEGSRPLEVGHQVPRVVVTEFPGCRVDDDLEAPCGDSATVLAPPIDRATRQLQGFSRACRR